VSDACCAAAADLARPRAAAAPRPDHGRRAAGTPGEDGPAKAAAGPDRAGLPALRADASGAELALAVRAGRAGALEAMIRAHQDALFGYVRAMLGDADEAEEAVQDAFVRAHRALTTRYDEARTRELDLRAWLFRIARNAAAALPDGDSWHETALRVVPDGPAEVESRERAEFLGSALAQLDASDRELLQLRFIEGLAYAEITELAGGTEAAVRGKVFRALQRLRGLLPAEEVTHAV
jgi:RNA polymerase sigma-70 factor (ECF subfamily)